MTRLGTLVLLAVAGAACAGGPPAPVAIDVRTGAVSGKVKRLRRNPRVRVAACTMRGRATGPPFDGVAALLSEGETQVLYALFAQKYGVLFRLGSMLRRRPMIGLRIIPDGQPPAA